MMSNREIKEILQRCINALDYIDRHAQLPDCNDCALYNTCDYAPKLGEQVRINCPLHRKELT